MNALPPSHKSTVADESQTRRGVIDDPWFVLSTIFIAAGAFGIPMIWICRGFSRRWKVIWSILAFFYTLAMVGFLLAFIQWSIQSLWQQLGS